MKDFYRDEEELKDLNIFKSLKAVLKENNLVIIAELLKEYKSIGI